MAQPTALLSLLSQIQNQSTPSNAWISLATPDQITSEWTRIQSLRSKGQDVGNAFDEKRVSGGSSSGSGVVVAQGLVPFSLGTDTARSGRVPAGLNNVLELKPTRGALSTTGILPACRMLDCVSIFAQTVDDAQLVLGIAECFDPKDAYSRTRTDPDQNRGIIPRAIIASQPVLAICANPEWFGHIEHAAA
ncbi:amidase signature domain-containing protein [Aspergillus filifer]